MFSNWWSFRKRSCFMSAVQNLGRPLANIAHSGWVTQWELCLDSPPNQQVVGLYCHSNIFVLSASQHLAEHAYQFILVIIVKASKAVPYVRYSTATPNRGWRKQCLYESVIIGSCHAPFLAPKLLSLRIQKRMVPFLFILLLTVDWSMNGFCSATGTSEVVHGWVCMGYRIWSLETTLRARQCFNDRQLISSIQLLAERAWPGMSVLDAHP